MLIIIGTAGSREKNIVSGITPAVNNNPTTTNTVFNARSRTMLTSLSLSNQHMIARTAIAGTRTRLWLASVPESDRLAAVPRWRRACRVGGHELVSHAQQVAQDIGRDAGQANQDRAVAEIVVGHVVNVGSRREQFSAVVEVNPNRKRTRLSRTINWHTCQKSSVNLERGQPVGCALFHAGQRQADLAHGFEVNCALWHIRAAQPKPRSRTHRGKLRRSRGST